MVHTKFGDSVPSAIVVSRNPRTSSLDEMKLYEGKYFFLENKQEFQLKLFNPLTEHIAARISFNDKSSSSMLVIRPGESVTIDRFLDDKNKMLFETYEYDAGNGDAEKAVSNNGKLKIEFFNEQPKWNITTTNAIYGKTHWGNQIYDQYPHTYTSNTSHDYNGLNNSGNIGLCSLSTSNTTSININNLCDTSGMYNEKPLSDVNAFNEKSFDAFKEASLDLEDIKETGRVEMGEESDQDFANSDKDFCTLAFHTVEYDLKPVSEHKNIVQTEIREYCTECGYRMRQKSWKFCPKCGTKN